MCTISGLTCGTPGDRGESWLPYSWLHYYKGIHKSLLIGLAAGFRFHATEQSWTVVPGMYGTHCKHSSLIPPLFPITTSTCLYMEVCELGYIPRHISRYMGQTSNNNNRFQLLIPVTHAIYVMIPVLYSCYDFLMICISDSIRLDTLWHEIKVYR